MCISTHFLATMFKLMGSEAKSRELHLRVLRMALAFDPTTTTWERPAANLSTKPWFMESKRFVEKAHQADRAAEGESKKGG